MKRTKKMYADQFDEIKIGSMLFYPSSLKMVTPLRTIIFTRKETDILLFFVDHLGKTVQRTELLLRVWGKNDYFLGRSMDVFISKLRKYLKDDPSVVLETLHKVGFKLTVKSDC